MTSAATDVEPVGLSVDDTIRQTVRALRAARQADSLVMARTLGISRQSLYNRLNGVAPFLAAEIAGLAHFFGVPIADFYEGVVRVGPVATGGVTGSHTHRYGTASSARRGLLHLVTDSESGNSDVVAHNTSSSGCAPQPHVMRPADGVNNANAA